MPPPTGVLRQQVLQLVDIGEQLKDDVQFGKITTYESLLAAVAKQIEWTADIDAFISKLDLSATVTQEYDCLAAQVPEVDEDRSRGDVIRSLQKPLMGVDWLNALSERFRSRA